MTVCPACGQANRLRAEAPGVPHCGRCAAALPWLVKATASDFEAVVERSPLPTLIDFWAPWCGPCRMVEPSLERLSLELAGKLKVAKVNTDEEPSLATRFEARGIPLLVLVEQGRERDRLVGARSLGELRSWLQQRLPTG